MVHDAEDLSVLSPNVMIKVPASMQGIQVVKILTSKGISTNTTVYFTLPQVLASADAAMEGIRIVENNRVDLGKWRAVITMMIGRLTEQEALDIPAERKHIRLSWQDKHWFGIAGVPPRLSHLDRKRYTKQNAGLLDASRAAGGRQDPLLGHPETGRRRHSARSKTRFPQRCWKS